MAEEQTTTEAVADDTGAKALPEEEQTSTAATDDSQQQDEQTSSDNTEGEQESSLPEVDDKLKAWAESKGIELDNESTIKAAKIAMDSQADFSRSRQGAKLKEAVDTVADDQAQKTAAATGQDPEVLQRLARMEVKTAVRDFFDANPSAKPFEDAMAAELQNRPYLAGDLEALYAVVASKNPDLLKSQGKKEALDKLAAKQRATAVNGSAVNSAPTSKKDDPFVKGLMQN